MADRRRARELARKALDRGEPLAWFEELYQEAEQQRTLVPWDDAKPNALMGKVLDGLGGAAVRALDVGTGYGDNAAELARRGCAVTAFDVSHAAIAGAKRRFERTPVQWRVASLTEPPAEWTGAFDLVVEIYTLQVLPPELRLRAIESLRSFVAPGGTLLVIARAREPHEDRGEMPWPLTRDEITSIANAELQVASLQDVFDDETPPVRRWVATFRRR